MWHLRVFEKNSEDVNFSYLFHTLDDVSYYILNASQLYDYRMGFIPIWEKVALKPPSQESETPFQFPEPLSAE
jgi:hypothetical protein